MNRVNNLVLCKEYYKTEEDFKNAVKDAIFLLLEAEYIMTVKYEEKGLGIVTIEYEYSNPEFGAPMPYWLSPDEFYSVVWDDEREGNDCENDGYDGFIQ